MGKIMAFKLDEKRAEELKKICAHVNAELVLIAKDKHGVSLGHIAGIPGFSARPASDEKADIDREMIVVFGMDDAALDAFLESFRTFGIPHVKLKAVMTPANCGWSARKLFKELKTEEQAY